ncbi:hypothetical protein MKW98_014553 [Papaver atlanticum]|uniref:Uncharacterized protein n=1 Tax=Papaver atlanticum TaxID=357466 RepID=A0AAD4SF19_9MAGN|nr:hypothetical protein MKW98_014553 [Papaver atlanticum]
MRKRGSSVVKSKTNLNLKVSPILLRTPNLSPKKFDFSPNGGGFNDNSSPVTKKKKTTVLLTSTSKKFTSTVVTRSTPPPSNQITSSTILDLKNQVTSSTDSIKRNLDLSHSEILKEFEAYQSRLSKRFKIHTQTCQQVVNEVEKEHKKMSDRITESMDVMKASYSEFIKESQASAARICKTSIPELTQSLEKSIKSLRIRYGVTSASK